MIDKELNELTRQGKNICVKCGNPKTMYYVPWCAKCDKPKVEYNPELNFIQCLEHLEANGHTGIKEILWSYFSGDIRNDSYFTLFFPNEHNKDKYDKCIYDYLLLIKETWNIKESNINMYVSW